MRHHRLASVALALLLVGSGAGLAASATASQGAQTDHQQHAQFGQSAAEQGVQPNQSATNVTALDAVDLVQNQTDGTVIGVRLVTANETTAFNVTVLSENLSVSQLTVSGAEPSVTATERNITVVRQRFLGGEAFAYDELRPAGEAIRLIQNETNGTVIQLGLRRGQLVYGVALRTPDDTRTQALVTATDSPVLGIQRARTSPAMQPNRTTAASS